MIEAFKTTYRSTIAALDLGKFKRAWKRRDGYTLEKLGLKYDVPVMAAFLRHDCSPLVRLQTAIEAKI